MRKRILVTALNWGLGHASRSIPVIHALQEFGAEVFLASDGRALELWRNEFPDLPLFELPGYNVRYPSHQLTYHLARQLPKIALAIHKERTTVAEIVANQGIEAIISDHRYGCYHPRIPSVLICHQMHIMAPGRLSQWAINQVHQRLLRSFQQHWVPDHAQSPGLAGQLSHHYKTDNTHFIGPLSRLKKGTNTPSIDYLVLLSGPEPQRTTLEKAIINQAVKIPGEWLIIGGKTESTEQKNLGSNLTYRSFAGTAEINDLIKKSRYVICRSGYSSIMDLQQTGIPALLIPTPGQTEQEYLAKLHQKDAQFTIAQQTGLDLQKEIIHLQKMQVDDSRFQGENLLWKAIENLLSNSF